MTKKTLIAAGGIVQNDAGEILLIFRRKVWDLPKGKLDEGETIEQCALREVEEETGLRHVQLGAFIQTTFHEYWDKWLKQDVMKETHWYQMAITGQQTLVPQQEEDIEEILWVKKGDVVNYMNNMHKNIIQVLRTFLTSNPA